jgi:hypothetical protein
LARLTELPVARGFACAVRAGVGSGAARRVVEAQIIPGPGARDYTGVGTAVQLD